MLSIRPKQLVDVALALRRSSLQLHLAVPAYRHPRRPNRSALPRLVLCDASCDCQMNCIRQTEHHLLDAPFHFPALHVERPSNDIGLVLQTHKPCLARRVSPALFHPVLEW